jgi:ABC-type glutathione transport system ATPase component
LGLTSRKHALRKPVAAGSRISWALAKVAPDDELFLNRFDQIVDFSGMEQFIDVPVKNYLSGMYVRLAFSVAAHLNPEIVILDEILAVGDSAFQKKCFDRMEEIINEGYAAVLVSHAMGNIQRMSHVCMWLAHGRVQMFGPTHEVGSCYEKQATHEVVTRYEKQTANQQEPAHRETLVSHRSWFIESKLATNPHTIVTGRAPIALHFEIDRAVPIANGRISVSVADVQGLVLFTQHGEFHQEKEGKLMLLLELPWLPVKPGEYIVSCTISDGSHPVALLRATPKLTILEGKHADTAVYHGLLNLPAKLSVQEHATPRA